MTTFTSDDREEKYKKILEAAPNQPGYEDAVPIPASPPHVVDSGASVMGVNANNLADELDEYNRDGFPVLIVEKAAIMLRKQFDQIADLQTTIKFLEEECKSLRSQLND